MGNDKRLSEEEKFKEYTRNNFSEIDKTLKSFALNLGSIARELGMNPKTFVKALYADEKNKAFYMKTLIYEQDYSMKIKNKSNGFFKTLINKLKSYGKRETRRDDQNSAGISQGREEVKSS